MLKDQNQVSFEMKQESRHEFLLLWIFIKNLRTVNCNHWKRVGKIPNQGLWRNDWLWVGLHAKASQVFPTKKKQQISFLYSHSGKCQRLQSSTTEQAKVPKNFMFFLFRFRRPEIETSGQLQVTKKKSTGSHQLEWVSNLMKPKLSPWVWTLGLQISRNTTR